VNISDGKTWTNRSYHFIAKPFVQKWVNTATTVNSLGPLAADVNHDGILEVFQTSQGKVICLNGTTGTLIWQYVYWLISEHSPFVISDLNHDDIPEIIISTNISQAGYLSRTIALHANNGSVYWNVSEISDRRHFVVADIDGNGYPYVYICCHIGNPGGGKIRMLRGTDGAELRSVIIYYPCYGGLSIADMDNDGIFELVLGDHRGYPGKGVSCYDARTRC
jgi:outer membrane protein assembly factor BamB